MNTETSPAKKSPQASNGPCVVDADFAAVLEEHFGIPAAFVLRALEGEPRCRSIAMCRYASHQVEPNGTLLMLARRFGRGRARRQRTAATPPRGHGRVSPRPPVDRSGRGVVRGRLRRDGCPLRGVCGPDVPEAQVERL